MSIIRLRMENVVNRMKLTIWDNDILESKIKVRCL